MHVSSTAPAEYTCAVRGTLEHMMFSGPTALCRVRYGERLLKVLVKNSELEDIPPAGDVWVSWPAKRSMLLHNET
jgi:hypothetical protein